MYQTRQSIPLHRRLLASISSYGATYKSVSLKTRIWSALTLRNIIILFWIYIFYWGERKVFRDAMHDCQWDKWEQWVCGLGLCPLNIHGGDVEKLNWRYSRKMPSHIAWL